MNIHDENALIVYTVGVSIENTRSSGAAHLLLYVDADGRDKRLNYSSSAQISASDDEIQLWAVVDALRIITGSTAGSITSQYQKIVIYCNSPYVVESARVAGLSWVGTPPQVPDTAVARDGDGLWKDLIRLKKRAGRVDFRYADGHGQNPYAAELTALAELAAMGNTPPARVVGNLAAIRR